jgi:hypothetical protein
VDSSGGLQSGRLCKAKELVAKMRLPKLLEPAKLIIQIPLASKHKTDKCLMCKTNKGETNK